MGMIAPTPASDAERQPNEPAAQSRLHSAQLWQATFEHAPDASIVVNRAGEIVEANRKCELLFGFPRSELMGLPVERLLPEPLHERHVHHRSAYISDPHLRPMGIGRKLFGQPCPGAPF